MPDESLTYKQMVEKIINDPGYAREIADLIARSRNKDQTATDELDKRFKPLPAELADLGLNPDYFRCQDTNPTQFFLIDFAAFLK